MNCFYCGKKQRGANQMFYKLDQDGHIICQSCMSAGYWKDALEIIEHNKQTDKVIHCASTNEWMRDYMDAKQIKT